MYLGLGLRVRSAIYKRTSASSILSGLLAYWKLDTNSWLDSSGNGNTLAYFGSQVSTATGKIGNSALFSGSNCLYKSSFSITTNCSFSFWFKSSTTTGADIGVGVGEVNGGYAGGFRVLSIDGQIYFQCPTNDVAISSGSYCDGTFHHCVAVASGDSTKLYLDGSLDGEFTGSLGTVSKSDMLIGSFSDGVAQNGTQIHEVGVWNRVLTGTEITSLYNAGVGKTYPFS
ncbi:MAG: LamG-like jellyroll fold domain-containing protein [Bacteroidota bacterium]